MSKKIKIPERNKKNFPYALCLVYWEDIVGETNWADIVDIKKATEHAIPPKGDIRSVESLFSFSFRFNLIFLEYL